MADTPQATDEVKATSENNTMETEDEGKEEKPSVLTDPELLASIQMQMGPPKQTPLQFYKSLPEPYRKRIKALKKLQLDATKIEGEFYKEVHALECKYAALYEPLYEKRSTIIRGKYEPTEEESDWVSDEEDEEEDGEDLSTDLKKRAVLGGPGGDDETTKAAAEEGVGIPGFWWTVIRNVEMLSEMVMSHDEPILYRLNDIKVEVTNEPMGFTLEFHFDANDWFTNTVLVKHYEMSCALDEEDPFSFSGPEIIKCSGCKIDWKAGKNVTVRTIQKKQKHKTGGATRTVTKVVQNDSFFNFFNPPQPNEEGEVDEDIQALLIADFEIGHFLRERIIPRAVLYFTGEALEDDEDEEDEEECEEEDDEDDDDDGDEIGDGSGPKFRKNKDQAPPECKQQ